MKIAANLHLKDGRYYYVLTINRKTKWHGLSRDEAEALAQYQRILDGEDPAGIVDPPGAWLAPYVDQLYRRSKARASMADIYFSLTRDDIREMGEAQNWCCFMTGIRFSRDRTENAHARAFSPSLDRINCRKGYQRDNVRLVCVSVNYALNEFGEEVFRKIATAYVRKAKRLETSKHRTAGQS